ncbi:hypothetical protein ABZV31_25515 [Streptomyces sp. NPDC005202]|uniref:hypothetical protein n=1 Tax=Streptomyces sp. NPDC005202 TaxID=3157021 RepID=UPI0033AC76F3
MRKYIQRGSSWRPSRLAIQILPAYAESDRALSEAVALILHAEAMTDKRGKWRRRRLAERLHQALERADVDGDPVQDELLLRKLATRKQAVGLASITLPPRWEVPASYTARESGHSRPRSDRPEALPRAEDAARPCPSDSGDDEVPPAARPQLARPVAGLPAGAETRGGPPLPNNGSGSAPGRRERKRAARKKPEDRKRRASDEIILSFTHRTYEETGSVGRDRVENALRANGYTVSSDDVGRIVREFKAQLKATAGDQPR